MKESGIALVRWKNYIGFVLLAAGGAVLSGWLIYTDYQPSGWDIWGHLYKAQAMYESMKDGDLFPLFNKDWYNGIQLYRYWGPLSYYVMALLQFLTGGDLITAYRILAGIIFSVEGIPWVIWGNISRRRVLGTFFGLAWFFVPVNTRMYFTDGNMPQMVTTAIVPYVALFLWLYLKKEKKTAGIGLFVCMALMSFTHLMVTAIMGVSAFFYLLIDWILNRGIKKYIRALLFMVAGIMAAGIWVIPALSGGPVTLSDGDGSVMLTYIYPLSVSLNPFKRLTMGNDAFYFGLASVVISVCGMFLAKREVKAGFILLPVLLVFTTPATYAVMSKLPLSGLFWMTRFSPMLYAFFFSSCMQWTTLRKRYCMVLAAVLLLDIVPCLHISFYTVNTSDEVIQDIDTLSDMTSQRTAIADLSAYGSYPSYGVSGANGVMYTFGWAWQGAGNGENIVLFDEAVEKEYFLYLFDRAVELGDDTVMLRKSDVEMMELSLDDICKAANESGYEMVQETQTGYIFKKDTPDSFGVVTQYRGLAIGKYSAEMTLLYPAFTTGESDNIEDYTADELSSYDALFLTGFEYDDREAAEKLVQEVAASGTRIVIDAAHLPSDSKNKQELFLGVLAQTIHFDDRYPTLYYEGNGVLSEPFLADDADFSTMYITGVDETLGTFYMEDRELTFLGTVDDSPNVYFLGLNIMYEAVTAHDTALTGVLDDILTISAETLPDRKLVPITVTYGKDELTIDVSDDVDAAQLGSGVNTTITYQDIFSSEQDIDDSENLLVVHDAHTVIKLEYPLFWQGLAVTVLGFMVFGILLLVNASRRRSARNSRCSLTAVLSW